MVPEKITIDNHNNEKLVGLFYKSNSRRIIIICHGIESTNNPRSAEVREAVLKYLANLHRLTGVNIFSFDFSGFGESDGEFSLSIRKRDHEIKTVLDYFASDYTDIILYGFSLAGVTAAIAARKYKMVTKLITINGFFTLNPFYLTLTHIFMISVYLLRHPSFLLDIIFWTSNLKIETITVPTIVITSEKDPIVHTVQSKYFYNKLKADKQFAVLPASDHAMLKEAENLANTVANWIKQH